MSAGPAAAVRTATALPRVVLALTGGAVADRGVHHARRPAGARRRPPTRLARVQAALLLAQSVPLLAADGALGLLLVARVGPGAAVAGCGIVLGVVVTAAARSRAFRAAGTAAPATSQPG